ncbi:MAG: hypothetical protein U9Q96_02250 [Patescibacteria group bacterium]|nr:hypothetical protein [Patescibacteria group bacterium]
MTNNLINNASLTKSIGEANIEQADKDLLLSKLPDMDEETRISLFKTLSEIHLLDMEEEQAKERVKKNWVE